MKCYKNFKVKMSLIWKLYNFFKIYIKKYFWKKYKTKKLNYVTDKKYLLFFVCKKEVDLLLDLNGKNII